jgi:hypothetical protein
MLRPLWSLETAFGAFIEATEFAAFAVAFHLDFAAVGAKELCGFAARRNWFTAASACNHGNC